MEGRKEGRKEGKKGKKYEWRIHKRNARIEGRENRTNELGRNKRHLL